jgi:hypothetical protein
MTLPAWVAPTPEEILSRWMIEYGFATGHGETLVDLLVELSWQVLELRRSVARAPRYDQMRDCCWISGRQFLPVEEHHERRNKTTS